MSPIDYWERTMREVSAALKARVTAKVNESVAKINTAHGITMRPISVRYDINSARLGGQAIPSQNVIRINPVFLNTHTEHYIAQVIPHEVAHLAVDRIHGRIRLGRGKISHHGPEWQAMMTRTLGLAADRCHAMVAPEGVVHGKQKTKYVYRCPGCGQSLVVGPKHHKNLKSGRRLVHTSCGYRGTFTYVAEAGRVSYAAAREVAANAATATPQQAPAAPVVKPPVAPRAGSKLDQCYEWYKAEKARGTDRQGILAVFVNEVGMTVAGASTYYSQCTKRYDAGV
jgi:SprT protein